MKIEDNLSKLIYVRSLVISEDIDKIVASLITVEKCEEFLFSLYKSLVYDSKPDLGSFVLLDKNLILKIYTIINQATFLYSNQQIIRERRRAIVNKLEPYLYLNEKEIERKVLYLLEKESEERRIPEEIILSKESLLELYKLDYCNYSSLYNHGGAVSGMNLFSFLSTIQKLYMEFPVFFTENLWVPGFYSTIADFEEPDKESILEKYLLETELRISGKETEDSKYLKKKIIVLPIEKNSN